MQTLDDVVPGYEPGAVKKVKKVKKPKPDAAPAVEPAPVTLPAPLPAPASAVTSWATFGVVFTLALSALLNGYANAQHAPLAFAGWLMGLAVPVLVLVLSKVAGEKFRSGQRPVAWFAGLSGVSLLLLSVWHCAESIAILTGSPVWLALPMSLAIDCGLVACEIALITEPRS